MNRRQLVLDAAGKALHVRRSAHISLYTPVCTYDLAQTLGLEVLFVDAPSVEGLYSAKPKPVILISSRRPAGRQNFTGAHELGHHTYGHGAQLDELIDETRNSNSPEETQANLFAALLLMPKSAVERAFTIRSWRAESCTPEQVYTTAGWLGVGYTTLVWHMSATLRLINQVHRDALLRVSLKQIRSRILGSSAGENLVVVDAKWEARAVDLQVGDLALLPPGTICEGKRIQMVQSNSRGVLYQAVTPGLGRFWNPSTGWATYLRISREDYVGRSIYRHEPESEDGEEVEENDNHTSGSADDSQFSTHREARAG